MAKDDVALKVWLSNKERFADLFNGTVFGGEQIVDPNKLTVKNNESVTVIENKNDDNGKAVQRYRDVVMCWEDKCNLMIIACENQGKVNYGMPVRTMIYDGMTYTEQIREYEDKVSVGKKNRTDLYYSKKLKELPLIPTLTLILYYGEEEWDGAKELYDMFDLSDDEQEMTVKKFVPNYKINLIELNNMQDFTEFKTDLQIVLNMLKYRKDKDKLNEYVKENEEYFKHIGKETFAAIGLLMNAKGKFDKILENDKEEMDMCKALDDIFEDGVNQGRSQERSQGISKFVLFGKKQGIDISIIRNELATEYNLSEDEIDEYMNQCV